jgi:hypothetical protein
MISSTSLLKFAIATRNFFMVAVSLLPFSRSLPNTNLQRQLIVDPLIGTIFGLTYTGVVIVLLPLSYFNHVLIAQAWNSAAGLSDRQTG